MLNLLDVLTETDNVKIENYIHEWGVREGYKGNTEYLSDWAASKKSLFRLLGGKLIHKKHIHIEKPMEIIDKELTSLFQNNSFEMKYSSELAKIREDNLIDWNTFLSLKGLLARDYLTTNKIDESSIKIKLPNAKTTLQIQSGQKTLKALQKVIDYFNLSDEVKSLFEKFRIEHSMIFNEKYIEGNLCFSIHPLDFMTMSDNNSGWKSCMSWKDQGCYHVGTIETMNSNNTICCYLESNKVYNFAADENNTDPNYTWTNKRWRIISYVTKDILLNGKGYPYQNKELSLEVVNELRQLAEKNWHHKYQFGPEPYQDMKHIDSIGCYDYNREWIRNNQSIKKNILIDTDGMYNDFFNDKNTTYWCVRNKPKKAKIISVSGKAKCLCCNNDVIYENENNCYEDYSYNSRYENCSEVMCYDCLRDYECDNCDGFFPLGNFFDFNGERYCEDCVNSFLKKCPCCGKPLRLGASTPIFADLVEDVKKTHYLYSWEYEGLEYFKLIYCDECFNKKVEQENLIKIIPEDMFDANGYKIDHILSKEEQDQYESHRYRNLLPINLK